MRRERLAKSKTTMRDVARAAGVSATTVWMVVHNKPGLPAETVRKVRAAMDKLSYVVKTDNNGSKAESVGLLIEQSSIPAISDVFYGDVIRGFQSEAESLGYHVVLLTFDRNTQDLDLLKSGRSEEHTSELQSRENLVCRLLLETKN